MVEDLSQVHYYDYTILVTYNSSFEENFGR